MIESLLAFACVIALCFFGVRVGIAALLVGFAGFWMERGFTAAVFVSGQRILHTTMDYNLSVIPLFVLMGSFIYHANISADLYNAAHRRLGKVRGGLAQATIVSCAAFAAVCGSSLATAATMTKVSLPSMRRYGYPDSLATGSIAAGGTLGILIPPSVPLIIYGIVAQTDIGKLFIAGILPGLMLVGLFMVAVAIWTRLPGQQWLAEQDDADAGDAGAPSRLWRTVLPILALFIIVIGGIYAGVFTPTEAAGIGSAGAALIALAAGKMRQISEWYAVLMDAAVTTSSLFVVIFGSLVLADYLTLAGLPFALLDFVNAYDVSPTGLAIFITVLAGLMGMVFDAMGILLLVVPVFLAALQAAGVDMVWFGIVMVMVTELGLITPPIGMNVFVVYGVAGNVKMVDIFRGVMPFIIMIIIALVLIFLFPGIATVLVNWMY